LKTCHTSTTYASLSKTGIRLAQYRLDSIVFGIQLSVSK
jgi:hypothetical protein